MFRLDNELSQAQSGQVLWPNDSSEVERRPWDARWFHRLSVGLTCVRAVEKCHGTVIERG